MSEGRKIFHILTRPALEIQLDFPILELYDAERDEINRQLKEEEIPTRWEKCGEA